MSDLSMFPTGQEASNVEQLAELVWNDLHQQVSLAQVREVTATIAARFRDARITVFIPIIVRRQARYLLEARARQGGGEHARR